tara:strand:- start:134 stop:1591 length:1458 start_codon:yes stop_codon:yes gene_type:complete
MQNKSEEIWMYIKFPKLSLEAITMNYSKDFTNKPLVVIDTHKNKRKIIAYNNLSKDYGIDKTISLSTALAICPDLIIKERNSSQEKKLLNNLAIIGYQFTADITIENHALCLEISKSKRLFRGYNNLLCLIHEKISLHKIFAINGFGINPLIAKILCKNKFQKNLPNLNNVYKELNKIPAIKITDNLNTRKIFSQLGIQSIKDLIDIPISLLSERFNSDLISNLEILLNKKQQILCKFKPSKTFHDEIQYINGLTNKESLIFPMKSLLKSLNEYLIAIHCRCSQIIWEFTTPLNVNITMKIKLSRSKNDWSELLNLSRIKLDNINLPKVVEKVSLYCADLIEDKKINNEIFNDNKNKSQYKGNLVDSIVAKVGEKALFTLLTKNEHIPKKAGSITKFDMKQFFEQQTTENTRPLWLLKTPNPIKFLNGKLYFKSPITILSGPERINDNWWENNQQLDYYIARDEEGTNYWIYKSGVKWFIHGIFS